VPTTSGSAWGFQRGWPWVDRHAVPRRCADERTDGADVCRSGALRCSMAQSQSADSKGTVPTLGSNVQNAGGELRVLRVGCEVMVCHAWKYPPARVTPLPGSERDGHVASRTKRASSSTSRGSTSVPMGETYLKPTGCSCQSGTGSGVMNRAPNRWSARRASSASGLTWYAERRRKISRWPRSIDPSVRR
jgi:hypothetical protein